MGYVIYDHLIDHDFSNSIGQFQSSIKSSNVVLLLLVLLLMPINWLLESKKWHLCMSHFHNITFKTALYSILSGISCGLLTPARIGEYFGRLLLVDASMNKASVYSSFLCSIAQNLITLTIGILGALYFCNNIELIDISKHTLISVNLIIVAIALLVYFCHAYLLSHLEKTKLYSQHLSFISEKSVSPSILVYLLGFSLVRYAVYLIQYFLLIRFLGLSSDTILDITAISTIYLIQSTLPLPPILGLLARGEIAVVIFSYLSYNPLLILLSTSILWVINLILPALIGLVIIIRTNIALAIKS